jgi:hypothetical protein
MLVFLANFKHSIDFLPPACHRCTSTLNFVTNFVVIHIFIDLNLQRLVICEY